MFHNPLSGAELIHRHAGHFIIEKGSDQVWLTAQDGAEVSGTALNVARTGGRSVAGLTTAEGKSVKRDVSGREIIDAKGDEKGDKLAEASKPTKQEKANIARPMPQPQPGIRWQPLSPQDLSTDVTQWHSCQQA